MAHMHVVSRLDFFFFFFLHFHITCGCKIVGTIWTPSPSLFQVVRMVFSHPTSANWYHVRRMLSAAYNTCANILY